MLIIREKLQEAFEFFAEQGNGVIVGPPGVGKTFLLKQFCESHSKEDSRCLYLPIDKLGVENDIQLAAELRLKGEDVIEHLRLESEDSPHVRFLILDAFDAARSENAQRYFLSFIRRSVSKLANRWNIVVSVRTYDARKSQELQDIFPRNVGTSVPLEYQMPDITCRHFSIPLLSDEERRQAVQTIDHLPDIFAKSSAEFRELLRTPFNLWLTEKLLSQNPDLVELSSVSSDIQLLGLFWTYRVVSGPLGEERRVVLSRVTREMVQARSMSVRTDEVYDVGFRETWTSLMTLEILVYAAKSQQRITFSHNILFDYAVSVLLIEDDAEQLAHFLLQDPSRPLFLRPSLAFYFTRLWHTEPQMFWRNFWQLLPSSHLHVRLFARLLPPTVVVNEARTIQELQPLADAVIADNELGREGVLRVLQANRMLLAARPDVWAIFLTQIATHIQKEFAWELAFATNAVLEIADKYKLQILRQACGAISRHLLLWVWQQRSAQAEPWLDSLGAVWATPLVAKTFDTEPAQSEVLLAKILDLLKEPDFPIDYFFRLANEIDVIWPHNPEFVSTLYKTIFGHEEYSQATTQFGTPVMPLTSTRRQDFEMCRYVLISKYPKFLDASPIIGTRTAIDCVNKFVIRDHLSRYSDHGLKPELNAQEFSFRGRHARYLSDSSYIWDQTYTEQPIKIADSLFSFIEERVADLNHSDLTDALLDELAEHALVAFFWKRLLDLGTRKPEFFAERFFELCVARPVLIGDDTIYEVSSFIEAAVPFLGTEKREQIEDAIIALAETTNEDDREFLERRRNRLLGRIPRDLLETEEAKKLRQQLDETESVPKNDRLFSITVQDGPYTGAQGRDLNSSSAGVTEEPTNQSLHKLTAALTAFTSTWQNNIPTETDVRAILKAAQDAYTALGEAVADDDSDSETALTTIASCATTMSRGIKDPSSSEFKFCRSVLLTCANHPSPLPHEEADRNYSHAYWSPAPRTEAAQGLPWLARIGPDPEMLTAIERLVKDSKPSVRFLVTVELFRVIDKSPEFFWKMALHIANSEQNNVITGALFRSLSYAASKDEDRTVQILETILQRAASGSDLSLFKDGVPIVVGLAIARENLRAITLLNDFLGSPLENGKLLRSCVFNALTFVTPQRLAEPRNVEGVDRAIAWVAKAIDSAGNGITNTLQKVKDDGGWTEESQNLLRDTYGVIDEIVSRLYFAARIKDKNYVREENEAEPTSEQQRQYYFKIKPLLERVVEFGLRKETGVIFAHTAHYFMELLNGVLKFDPTGALHLASGVAQSSEQTGYNLDPMAISEVVKLVEAILADHRYEVRHGQPLEDLMNLLDIFAKTGNAQALNLVWRLDEIFR